MVARAEKWERYGPGNVTPIIAAIAEDMDEFDERLEKIDGRLAKIMATCVGILATLVTSSVLLVIDIAVRGG